MKQIVIFAALLLMAVGCTIEQAEDDSRIVVAHLDRYTLLTCHPYDSAIFEYHPGAPDTVTYAEAIEKAQFYEQWESAEAAILLDSLRAYPCYGLDEDEIKRLPEEIRAPYNLLLHNHAWRTLYRKQVRITEL